MSSNGKQVQLAPNQNQRFTCMPTRPVTPRTDGFPMPSGGGVSGGYLTSNATGGHHNVRGLPQAPTPPQQDIKQAMYSQQGGVRAQQYPQQQFRGAPPQPQPNVVLHHQPRPSSHHRQQAPAPTQAPAPAAWASQQMVFNMPMYIPTHMTLPQTSYAQQQPSRTPFYPQPTQHSLPVMQQHAPFYCPPAQQQFMYQTGRGGPSPGQMPPTQTVPQQQQTHSYINPRYSSPMSHSSVSTNEKKSRSHAIPIIDPKSGKRVVQDENDNGNESGDRQVSQQDENSAAAVEEFSRRITNAANEKDEVEQITKDIECETRTDDGGHKIDESNQNTCSDILTDHTLSEIDYNDEKVRHNALLEINETPVVSAISNSPEIVPKQCHIIKQKQVDNISVENKKNQASFTKAFINQQVRLEPNAPEDLSCVKMESKEFGAQQILTSALQPPKAIEEETKTGISVVVPSEDAHLRIVDIPPSIPVSNSTTVEADKVIDPAPVAAPIAVALPSENVVQPEYLVADQFAISQKPKTESKKQERNNSLDPVTQIDTCETESTPDNGLNNDSSAVIYNVQNLPQELSKSESIQDVALHSLTDVSIVELNLENIKISNNIEDSDVTKDLKNQPQSDENIRVVDESSLSQLDQVHDNMDDKTSNIDNIDSTDGENFTSATMDLEKNDQLLDIQESVEKCDEKPKAPVLRYNYKEDQWSPLNTSGKKYYDSDFLLALKNNPNSKIKPENLSQTDIYADNLNRQSRSNDMPRSSNVPRADLLPVFVKSNMHSVTPNRKSQHGKPLKDSKGNPAPGQISNRPNIIHVNLSLRSDVKLNESENAWKPSRMRQENLSEEELQTRELCKTFTSVLNKLTPQNFDTLIAQVRSFNINTEDRLSKVIDLVFEKAIDEPNFSLTYALMCKELSGITLPSTEKNDVTFRSLIIKKCQYEFEKEDDTAKRMQKEIDECTDADKKKEMILNLEEVESKIRRRSVGNVRFIGEIFKQNLIRPNIIVGCIKHLLSKVEEETLECLCKLLTTIGKDLEKKYKEDLQPYFNTMRSIVETKRKEVSSRVRFMLQDVIDLRLNNWVPRQQVVNPKTIDQIKLEMELEQNKPSMFPNYTSPANLPRKDERPNNMNKRGGSKSVTEEGWSPAPSRNSRSKTPFSVDPGKLYGIIPATPVPQTALQPPTQHLWSKGSTVIKKMDNVQVSSHKPSRNPSSNGRKPATTISNSYHPLENQNPENMYSGNLEGPSQKLGYKSKGASIERSTFKSDESESPAGSTFTSCEDKINEVLLYAHSDTVYGMLGHIQMHIKNPQDIPLLCKELILWGLKFKKKENMCVIGEVTGTLVDDEMITSEEFCKVLKETMDMSSQSFQEEDPIIWKMLGGFIWAHMKKNSLSLEQIHQAFSKVVELEYGFNLLTAIFMEKLKEPTTNDIKMLWEKSSLTLADWMDEDRVEQFSEEFQLKWIYQKGLITPDEACSQLLKQMQEGKSRDQVKDWIQKNIGNSVHEGWFIRALTEAIHTYGLCCHEAPKKPTLDTGRLERFYPLLSTYIGGHEKQELECLFAIQRLINKHEHPQGITGQLFEYLWECGDMVSLEGITTWEKNKDPKEQEGKGVILKTLTSFLTSIKSEEQSSDEGNIFDEGY